MLELLELHCLGREERRRGAAGNVVAGKGEDVEEDRQAEGDASSTETEEQVVSLYAS